MRNRVGSPVVLAGLLALCLAASVRTAQAQGNKPAQGAEGPGARKDVLSSNPNAPFDAHDLSGIWMTVRMGGGGIGNRGGAPWPMTPWAQARYNTAKPGLGQRGQPLGNDPIMLCDPIGYPRVAEYQLGPAPSQGQADSKQRSQATPERAAPAGGQATTGSYPMEFVQTKDRLIEFFDFFYVHRTIFLDGRKLPADPDPTWYGYSVGHWDGNTLVVDTTGFNDQSWLDSDGHPHSDQMQLQERFQRVDHDTIQATMTVTDPKAYTAWLVSSVTTWKLAPNRPMREDLCAPSDELRYLEEMREPAAERK